VYGSSNSGDGVYGSSNSGDGVRGESYQGNGAVGTSNYRDGVFGFSVYRYGVTGYTDEGPAGVYGSSLSRDGVVGEGLIGVIGRGRGYSGVVGYGGSGYGVRGESSSGYGVSGHSFDSDGVVGVSLTGPIPRPPNHAGVYGASRYGHGVRADSYENYALYARGYQGYAAYLDGEVTVNGPLIKRAGQFKIDHPLDPANKYLSHSFVESPDMKNVYDGVVVLDSKGEAEIGLPEWFGALNKDFRYQLTAIGAPGPNLYIAEEISEATTTLNYGSNNNNSFKIAGGNSGMKVSWQVTGIRQDPYAKAHPIQVEEDKPDKERGYYLHPDLYGQPEENGLSHLLFPEKEKKQELLINENKPNL
jgi:hypothetical protein